MAYNELDPYRYSSVKGIDYSTLTDLWDEADVALEVDFIDWIEENHKLDLSHEDIEEVVHTWIEDVHNG